MIYLISSGLLIRLPENIRIICTQLYEDEMAEMETPDGHNRADVQARLGELHAEIDRLNGIPDQMEKDFLNELNTTLKNAYLMPAKLRDTAHLFLESRQSDFKVGLFGSKKKTEEERHKRENDFLTGLQQNIETSVQWRLRDKLLNLLHDYGLYNQELTQQIQNISITYDSESLKALIKPGATVNGDYVLHYTEDVSHDVKKTYKQEVLKLMDSVHDEMTRKIAEESAAYESERDKLEQIHKQQETQESLKNKLQEQIHKVDAALAEPQPDTDIWALIKENLAAKQGSVTQAASFPVRETIEPDITETNDQPAEKPVYPVQTILHDLEKTTDTISDLPGFRSIIDDLKRKHDRLNNRTYTIALFGAFSAGKSSLANALIGEHIFAIGAKPTTAVTLIAFIR
ncbi:hypothetical protein Len3610_05515 [Lentibacillus sp. CBA3610]|nr:hypothetical protein Len3610_05515 [Lentibacillus sp. CBA3610]